MHSKVKGVLGELKITSDLINKGYELFTEFDDNSKIDLIACSSDYDLIKIQVKSLSVKDGVIELKPIKSGPNYSFRYERHQIDVYAVYVLERELCLYVSADELLSHKRALIIRIDETKNNQTNGVNLYSKYLDFEAVK